MSKWVSILVGINFLGLLALLSVVLLNNNGNTSEKAGYIDRLRIFNEFDMRKDIATEFEAFENSQLVVLDSLRKDLEVLKDSMRKFENPPVEMMEAYNNKRKKSIEVSERANQLIQSRSVELSELIWEKINVFIGEYGEENQYGIIYGIAGEGNIMYADSTLDITNDVLQYLNTRYKNEK